MKKRVLAGIMAGCMIIGTLTACGQGSTDTEKSDDSASAATTEEAGDASEDEASAEDLRVTMILSDRDEWLSEMESGALAAAEEIGIDLVTQDAQKDTSKMLQFIETAKNDGQKAVIVNMVDPSDCDNTQNRFCIKRIERQRNQRDRGNCSSRCRL